MFCPKCKIKYKLSHEALTWFASYLGKIKQKGSLNNVFIQDEIITDVLCHTGHHFRPSTFAHVY